MQYRRWNIVAVMFCLQLHHVQGQFLYNVSDDPNERTNLYDMEEYAEVLLLLEERLAYFQQFEREALGQESYSAGTWTRYGAAVPWKDYETPPVLNTVPRQEPQDSAPHIVFIMVDDVGWSDVGYSEQGSGWAKFATPRIDELAEKGIILNSHYTSWVCGPSRSSFLTGRYANRLGFAFAPGGIPILPLDEVTIAQELQLLGYRTALVGKWHMGFQEWAHTPLYRGFDAFYGFYGGSVGYYSKRNQADFVDFFDQMSPVLEPSELSGHLTEVLQGKVESLIEEHATTHSDTPLFLYYAMQNVHTGIMGGDEVFEAPQEYLDMCQEVSGVAGPYHQYICALLIMMDESVGRTACTVQEHLEARGRDSLIIFASDNGAWGQMPGSNLPHRGSKGSIVQGGIQNPAFMFGSLIPEVKRGTVYRGLVHLTDWYRIFTTLGSNGNWSTSINQSEIDGFDVLPAILYDQASPRREVFHNRDVEGGSMQVGYMKYILGTLGGATQTLAMYELNGETPLPVCEIVQTQSPAPTLSLGRNGSYPPSPQSSLSHALTPTLTPAPSPPLPTPLTAASFQPSLTPIISPAPSPPLPTLRPCTFLDQLLGFTDCVRP